VDSERVLYLAFPVRRSSYISSLSWKRIRDLIDKDGELSWRHYELYPLTLNHLSTLSILCQGYLAAHGGSGLNGWEELGMEIKRRVVSSRNRERLLEPSKWCGVLSSSDDWQAKLRREAIEQARLRSLPGEAEKIMRFIEVLEADREWSELVEPTYQATRRLLGEA